MAFVITIIIAYFVENVKFLLTFYVECCTINNHTLAIKKTVAKNFSTRKEGIENEQL